jgi:electron transfer flavoprotein alpha subunit
MKTGELWVVIEHRNGELPDISKEVCCQGRRMKGPDSALVAILMGNGIQGLPASLGRYGVEKVYLVENNMGEQFNPEAFIAALSNLVHEKSPSIVLCGSTPLGNAIAAQLAIRAKGGLVTDCLELKKHRGGWSALKPVQQGRINARIAPRSEGLQIFTLKRGAFEVDEVSPGNTVEVDQILFQPHWETLHTKIVGFVKSDPRTVRLEHAELIVAGGKGVGDKKGFKLLEDLADLLGATIAGSRAAVDMGLVPYERQIGLTGKRVTPRLFIAIGISGVFEFAIGIKDAKFVIAINKDASAPIFKVADIGIVGDLNEILPGLNEKLRTRRN